MAEIENGAARLFALVAGNDLCLDLAGTANGVDEGVWLAGDEIVHAPLEPSEEARVGDHTVLDHLGKAGAELAFGQRAQHTHVRHHGAGLVERADEVLAGGVIHGSLAAHGRVHLGQQRRRHLNQAHAALIARRGESGHIPYHAAAQGDQRRGAVVAALHEAIEHGGPCRHRLEALAVADLEDVELGHVGEALAQTLQTVTADRGVGHHHRL